VLGLPGNPVSSIVCGVLFVRPLVRALSGDRHAGLPETEPAILGTALGANEGRQDYMRATIERRPGALPVVHPASVQDSSMLSVLAGAQGLVVRPPHAPAEAAGTLVAVIRLAPLLG
jgi:molybdopterin molybdotransferase